MGGLTFGAIGAALIAAVVSLIGLILGKEQKTSEFRQEWINKLREEIASYVTNVSAISDQVKFEFKDRNEKLKHLSPFYVEINSAANSIKLRLNPDENDAKAVLEVMDEIETASQDDDTFTSEEIRDLENKLISRSQKLLKSEWRRVKAGETAFKIAKYSAFALTIMLSALLVYAALATDGPNERAEAVRINQPENTRRVDELLLPAPEPVYTPVPVPSATADKPVTAR
ncbi:hypothetical protein BPTFM16_00716 [Altererythrobacter insulae]|nr:hypothetical protein BPTFM16_00716 [Altererythrobacter insulae]